MAARTRRKRTKAKKTSSSFDFLNKKKSSKRQIGRVGPTLMGFLKVLAVICFLSAIAIGLLFLEEHVKDTAHSSNKKLYLELANVPSWVDSQLQNKVLAIAGGDEGDIRFDERAARSVRRNIEEQFAWLDDVTVRAGPDVLRIEGRWRKPLALVRSGVGRKYYVDAEQVVLDFVPMTNLPIVEIAGLSMQQEIPPPGQAWRCDDLAAAITILDRMGQLDRSLTPDKPLLFEIGCIDMSNFSGRKNSTQPHIVLHTQDNIEIIWGAEWGKWQQYLESRDDEKLAKLYDYYNHHGTLSVGVKYINLRDPQDKIPLPIDKY
ncbi:MAG: hypothetical protein JSW47_02115 [Phycisphaerales bacterium]|nr:MAG: hypothetical protein JSW47_02115 [Phycisphaerales bacterium]